MSKNFIFAPRCQVVLILLAALMLSSQGIAGELRFSQLNKDRGLSQGRVTGLAMGPAGLLWIGTEDGLFRYDGFTVTPFRNDPDDLFSIPDNVITALAVDGGGKLWVGSESDGASFYDSNKIRFVRLEPEEAGRSTLAFFTNKNSTHTILQSEAGFIEGVSYWRRGLVLQRYQTFSITPVRRIFPASLKGILV